MAEDGTRSLAELLLSFSVVDLVQGISPEGAAELLATGRQTMIDKRGNYREPTDDEIMESMDQQITELVAACTLAAEHIQQGCTQDASVVLEKLRTAIENAAC